MVEYTQNSDLVFQALADSTRRDILVRLRDSDLNISQIALAYDMSIAAVSKHIAELESAGLVFKHREGRYRIVRLNPDALMAVWNFVEDMGYDVSGLR